MNKLIIDNRTDLPDLIALDLIRQVILQGRINNDGKQYCYISFVIGKNDYQVWTDLNKKSDKFIITQRK